MAAPRSILKRKQNELEIFVPVAANTLLFAPINSPEFQFKKLLKILIAPYKNFNYQTADCSSKIKYLQLLSSILFSIADVHYIDHLDNNNLNPNLIKITQELYEKSAVLAPQEAVLKQLKDFRIEYGQHLTGNYTPTKYKARVNYYTAEFKKEIPYKFFHEAILKYLKTLEDKNLLYPVINELTLLMTKICVPDEKNLKSI